MDNAKVYLRIETPFSPKNRKTLFFALHMIISVVFMAVVAVMMYQIPHENPNVPQMVLGVAIAWLIMGAIPTTLILFNTYARVEEGELIVNSLGFSEKRYPRGTAKKAVKEGEHTVIYGDDKPLVSMLSSKAADDLVRSLRIPIENSTRNQI